MTPHHYSCHSCQEPLTVSIAFQAYILSHGSQSQRCGVCGAVHSVAAHSNDSVSVALAQPGVLIARLSAVYDFPEYKPYRVGAYRVWFAGHENEGAAKRLCTWTGEYWANGLIRFSDSAIVQWQGLGGDMEHTKRMPYEHDYPFSFARIEYCD